MSHTFTDILIMRRGINGHSIVLVLYCTYDFRLLRVKKYFISTVLFFTVRYGSVPYRTIVYFILFLFFYLYIRLFRSFQYRYRYRMVILPWTGYFYCVMCFFLTKNCSVPYRTRYRTGTVTWQFFKKISVLFWHLLQHQPTSWQTTSFINKIIKK